MLAIGRSTVSSLASLGDAVDDDPKDTTESSTLRRHLQNNNNCRYRDPVVNFEEYFFLNVTMASVVGEESSSPDASTLSVLGDLFLSTLQDLISCPENRRNPFLNILNVVISEYDDDQSIQDVLSGNQNGTDTMSIQRTYVARVIGECNACSSGVGFFSDLLRGIEPFECDCTGPSMDAFLTLYQSTLKTNGLASSFDVAGIVLAEERPDCTEKRIEFNTTIAMSVPAEFAYTATKEQLSGLAQAYMDTYNSVNNVLSSPSCDPKARRIIRIIPPNLEDEDIVVEFNRQRDRELIMGFAQRGRLPIMEKFRNQTRDRYSREPSEAPSYTPSDIPSVFPSSRPSMLPTLEIIYPVHHLEIFFYVTGFCRNCESDQNLFDNDVSGRRQRHLEDAILDDDESLACLCPADSDIQGPSQEKVARLFQDRVDTIDILPEDVDVRVVVEVEPVSCPSDIVQFTTQVRFPLVIDDASGQTPPSEEELQDVADCFVKAYNHLTRDNFCDPLFRSIENARVRELVRLDDFQSVVIFDVEGRCRGCETGTWVFDDPGRLRDLIQTMDNSATTDSFLRRRMEDGLDIDTCYCEAIASVNKRQAPFEVDLEDPFEECVVSLENPSIGRPTDPPSTSPSMRPSKSPSDMPTDSPSKEPTPSPSDSPTFDPCPPSIQGQTCECPVVLKTSETTYCHFNDGLEIYVDAEAQRDPSYDCSSDGTCPSVCSIQDFDINGNFIQTYRPGYGYWFRIDNTESRKIYSQDFYIDAGCK